ncbi:MAG: acetamidase/formamidase family protein [Candidatus Eisenbacteria bacterium]|nr:acetamidase/formamidase family protein [Candidatus Eisenbacteria bacterium]
MHYDAAVLHRLDADARTLHGHFSRDLPPLLTIDAGDRVRYSTLDAAWGERVQVDPYAAPKKFTPRDGERDPGHALTGPIAVRGAEPGMTLEVRLVSIRPGAWGWSGAGGVPTPLNRRLGTAERRHDVRWAIHADEGVAIDARGRRIAIRPFMGVLGNAPAEPGRHSTSPPRAVGGNIDCKELVAGSVLHLPIAVPGALFSVGDAHAVQGDGEVGGVAVECPADAVEIEFGLGSGPLAFPRAETPAGWITFGFADDLDEAADIALDGMLALLGERHGMGRSEALAFASLAVDLRVTQIVNGARGVHAVLGHGAPNSTVPARRAAM